MRRRGFLGLLVAAATAKPALAALSATPATLVLKEANTNTAPPPPYSFSNCGHTALNCECNTLPRPAIEFRADTNSGFYHDDYGTLRVLVNGREIFLPVYSR